MEDINTCTQAAEAVYDNADVIVNMEALQTSQFIFQDEQLTRHLENIIQKAKVYAKVSKEESSLFTAYLIARLKLNHFKSDKFILELKKSHFLNAQFCDKFCSFVIMIPEGENIKIMQHPSEAELFSKPMSCVSLNHQEFELFQIYYEHIRPQYMIQSSASTCLEDQPFFVTVQGKPVNDPDKLLRRLFTKLNYLWSTPKTVTRAMNMIKEEIQNQTLHDKPGPIEDSHMHHICLNPQISEFIFQYQHLFTIKGPDELQNVILARNGILAVLNETITKKEQLPGFPAESSKRQEMLQRKHSEGSYIDEKDVNFSKLMFKLKPDAKAKPIGRTDVRSLVCQELSDAETARLVFKYNYKRQMQLISYLAETFRCTPTNNAIKIRLKTEHLQLEEKYFREVIINYQQPGNRKASPSFLQITDESELRQKVLNHSWEGLVVRHRLVGRQRGIFTSRPFQKNEVISDYSGIYLDSVSGETLYQERPSIYMFQFEFKNQSHWRDASAETGTFGRLINHSIHPNVKPCVVDLFRNNKPHVIFVTLTSLPENSELFWSYGTKRDLGSDKLDFYHECYCPSCSKPIDRLSRF